MKNWILCGALLSTVTLFGADAAVPAPENAPAAIAPATAPEAQPAGPALRVTVAVPALPAADPVPAEQAAAEEEPGIVFCLARGICNIGTGWLELPRCMIYDNCFMPVFGLLVGIPEGACLTVSRTLCGVYDILSFGTSGSTFHGEIFPNTVFQSKWIYRKK